jgi:hypothetical protein
MKTRLTKLLILVVFLYSMSLVTSLWNNSGSRRFINIEQKNLGGVVNINTIKYKTTYLLQQAQIGFTVDNGLDYLFLAGAKPQDSFIGVLVKLAFATLLIIFLWRFDSAYPFQYCYYKQLRWLFGIFVICAALELIKNYYTSNFISMHLQSHSFYYQRAWDNYIIYFEVVIFGLLLNAYHQAVKNQAELDLTI